MPIEMIETESIRAFFWLAFSAIIITKPGEVSLAFDLTHTRPHKAKVAISQSGEVLFGEQFAHNPSARIKLLTKKLRSPLAKFEKRVKQNIKNMLPPPTTDLLPLQWHLVLGRGGGCCGLGYVEQCWVRS